MHNCRSTRQQRLQKEEITRNRSDNESLSFRSITKIAAIHKPHRHRKLPIENRSCAGLWTITSLDRKRKMLNFVYFHLGRLNWLSGCIPSIFQSNNSSLYRHFYVLCIPSLELSWVEFIGVIRHMERYFSYICAGTDVQADWRRSRTYGRAPNAIDISQGYLMCPSHTDKGPTFPYCDSDTTPL